MKHHTSHSGEAPADRDRCRRSRSNQRAMTSGGVTFDRQVGELDRPMAIQPIRSWTAQPVAEYSAASTKPLSDPAKPTEAAKLRLKSLRKQRTMLERGKAARTIDRIRA